MNHYNQMERLDNNTLDRLKGTKTISSDWQRKNVSKIYPAIPSATVAERRDILAIYMGTNSELKNFHNMEWQINTN